MNNKLKKKKDYIHIYYIYVQSFCIDMIIICKKSYCSKIYGKFMQF